MNAFWLLPNIYAVITQGNAIREAKVNQLFSDEAYEKGQQFGTWDDALTLKNFLFDWQMMDTKTLNNIDVLNDWIPWINKPYVQALFVDASSVVRHGVFGCNT